MSVPGFSLPQGLAHSFWSRYAITGVRLTDIATFPGDPPAWAAQPAKFALTSCDSGSRTNKQVTELDVALVHVAADPNAVFEWFHLAKSPFLVPDPAMGAQLVFVLETEDVHRAVFIDLEPFQTDRPHRVSTVVSVGPDKLYKTDHVRCAELCSVLATYAPDADSEEAGATPKPRDASFSTLQLYCFARLFNTDRADDPPAATLRVADMAKAKHIKELGASDVAPAFA